MIQTLSAVALAAAAGPPPITVQSCSYVTAKGGAYRHGVDIVYVNTAKVTATHIEFAITHGNSHYHVVDKGTFAPGGDAAPFAWTDAGAARRDAIPKGRQGRRGQESLAPASSEVLMGRS